MTTTTRARAWSIRRSDGLELGFTDHDNSLAFEGIEFQPSTGLSAGALVQSAGLSVDNTEVVGALNHDAISEPDLRAGRWDGAEIRFWEVNWRDSADRSLMFRGTLGEIVHGNGSFRAELRGLSDRLGGAGGRVYHPRCSAALGDRGCGVALDDPKFVTRARVTQVSESSLLRVSCPARFGGRWFEHGRLRVETGAAVGLTAQIKIDRMLPGEAREIELWTGLAIPPKVGDEVELRAGCNKTAQACQVKFDNFLNFRGFPHLPGEDWLVSPQNEQRRADPGGLETFMPAKSDDAHE